MNLAEIELSNAVPALKNGQIDGFVTAGSWPAPNVIEAAAGTGVTVLSLSDDQIAQTKRAAPCYPGRHLYRPGQRHRDHVASGGPPSPRRR